MLDKKLRSAWSNIEFTVNYITKWKEPISCIEYNGLPKVTRKCILQGRRSKNVLRINRITSNNKTENNYKSKIISRRSGQNVHNIVAVVFPSRER